MTSADWYDRNRADDIDDESPAFERIRVQDRPAHVPDRDEGWRLHLYRLPYEPAQLVEEQVLPEKVNDPNANRIIATGGRIWFTASEVRWLRDQLTELLAEIEKERP